MKYRQLDENGDMQFGGGISDFLINSPEAVAQAIVTTLKLFLGEWFIDINAGIPYYTKVIGFGNIPGYNFVIRNAILGVQGVTEIVDYYSTIDTNRALTINATVNTVYGITYIQAIL